MGLLQRRVNETLSRTEDFLSDVRALGSDPAPADVSMMVLRGRVELSTIEALSRDAEKILEGLTDPVQKNLCLQLMGVLQTESAGLKKVLDALTTADQAEKLNAEAEIRRELEKIREKPWETTNEN